jgi:HD-GYP domain-containing protein (c-di-GMP phosphodiesterase class II)
MRLVNVDSIERGMRLGDPVFAPTGQMLLAKGVELTSTYVERLRSLGVPAVYIQDPDTADVQIPYPIPPEARAKLLGNLTRAFEQVSRSADVIRQMSAALLRQEITAERFASAVAGTAAGAALAEVGHDVETMIHQLSRHDVLTGLNSIKTHDRYTFTHSLDVTIMGLVLAQKAGWEKLRLKTFGIGCLLHDVGKILIEPELLNKAGPLTPQEFETLKAHTTTGFEIIRAIAPRMGPLVPQVALQHHERHDGSGYPNGVLGNERLGINEPGKIHDFAAVCAVADIYDAMTSHRPYRPARPTDQVVGTILKYSGVQLSAEAVKIFSAVVTPYPICSLVEVKNGKHAGWRGIVVRVPRLHLARPTVRLLYNPQGERTSPVEINLAVEHDVAIQCATDGEPPTAESLGAAKLQPAPPPRKNYVVPPAVLAALRDSSTAR